MRRIYISGPMTGHEAHNFPAFFAAERYWRGLGWLTENPARHFGGRTDLSRSEYMRADFQAIVGRCDAIALMAGWESSPGSLAELVVSNELNLEVFDAATGLPLNASVEMKARVQ